MKLEVMASGCSNAMQWLEACKGSVSNAAWLEENFESKRWQTHQEIEVFMDHHIQIVKLTCLVPF